MEPYKITHPGQAYEEPHIGRRLAKKLIRTAGMCSGTHLTTNHAPKHTMLWWLPRRSPQTQSRNCLRKHGVLARSCGLIGRTEFWLKSGVNGYYLVTPGAVQQG